MFHPNNTLIQRRNIINNWRQILDHQVSFRIGALTLESLEIRSSIASNIDHQRCPILISIEQKFLSWHKAVPFYARKSLADHKIVEVDHMFWMSHEPGEQLEVGGER